MLKIKDKEKNFLKLEWEETYYGQSGNNKNYGFLITSNWSEKTMKQQF